MEFTESQSEEPASLSPDRNPATKVASIPSRPSQRPLSHSPDASLKKREQKPSAEKSKKKDVFKEPDKEPVPAERKVSVPEVTVKPSPSSKPTDLPHLAELIPSIQRLLALENANRSRYEHFSLEQDGRGELPARVQFNEYLAELKRRVERNWRISRDYYMVDGTTVLLIVINADGTLRSVDQLKSSGMPSHDFETVAAVRQSFPFRPPSKDLLNEQGLMLIRFSFHYIIRPVT